MSRSLLLSGLMLSFLLMGSPEVAASGGGQIGPFAIEAAPVEANVVFGAVPTADWLNVVNVPVTVEEAFTDPDVMDTGFANVPRVNTSDVHVELRFASGVVNGPGPDLLIVAARFSATAFGLRSAHDAFGQQLYVSSTAFVDTGENRLYYYGQTVGPYEADVFAAPVDLSDLNVPECAVVDTFRLVLFEGSEADVLGLAQLPTAPGLNLTAAPETVSVGDNLDLVTCGGVPGNLVLLFLTAVNGTPLFVSTNVLGVFDVQGQWVLSGPVPADPTLEAGIELTLRTLSLGAGGQILQSNDQAVTFDPS